MSYEFQNGAGKVAIVTAQFLPSNLAGVQRPRLMAGGLRDCGWDPTIITVDPEQYEETNDPESLCLAPANTKVRHVGAVSKRLCRPLGFGDLSLRGQWSLRRGLRDETARGNVDLVFATILPGFIALVGAWAKRKLGLPFVLDYQDPWVTDWGAHQRVLSKAGLAHKLAVLLEPQVVRQADAITAVSQQTLDTLRARHLLKANLPIEVIPIGADSRDHEIAMGRGRSRVRQEAGVYNAVYMGTITDRMLPALKTMFLALAEIRRRVPSKGLRLHLIGTTAQPDGRDSLGIKELATACGVGDALFFEPRRIGYLDALRSMQDADLLLLLGSTDPHYTASKIFPCWLAAKPILGVFHEASTVAELSRQLGGMRLVVYSGEGPEQHVAQVVESWLQILQGQPGALPARNPGAFAAYSARGVASRFASLFDQVVRTKN